MGFTCNALLTSPGLQLPIAASRFTSASMFHNPIHSLLTIHDSPLTRIPDSRLTIADCHFPAPNFVSCSINTAYMFLKTLLYTLSLFVFTACASSKNRQPTTAPVTSDTITYQTQSQTGWQVYVNKQLIIQSNTEDITVNSKTVKAADLFAKEGLKIVYTEAPDAKVIRSYIIMDTERQELFRTDKIKEPVQGDVLKKAIGHHQKIEIYSLAIPSDPALAATVRVRPVHLCTLILE